MLRVKSCKYGLAKIVIMGLIIFMLSINGCVPTDQAQLEINKGLVKQFEEILNSADWDRLDDLLAEDFLRHSQATTDMRITSRDEMKQLMHIYQAFAPDQKLTIDFLIAEGDMVAGYGTYSGTNTGSWGDMPATGNSFELKNISIFRIENGRIAEQWVEWDNLAMLTQLGVFPPPSE
jgi:steroid delta-isomerase-like uncharacterized protein